jgi:hypothetical protein
VTPEEVATLIKAALRRPIAYHRIFTEIAGKTSAGVMLSQAWYWSERTEDPEGWFYKTRDDWTEETGMTRTEQETARRRLISAGVLEEELRGMPAKMHFRVNEEKLISLLVEKLPTVMRKSRQQVSRKAADTLDEKPPTPLITESTTETTDQIEPPFSSPEFTEALEAFEQVQRENKKPLKPVRRKRLYNKLAKLDEAAAVVALNDASDAGWRTVYPRRNGNYETAKQSSAGQQSGGNNSGSTYDPFAGKSVV